MLATDGQVVQNDVVAGAPSYLEKRGTPQKPGDLLHHDCIGFRMGASDGAWSWELERGKKTLRIPVRGPVLTNDANQFVRDKCLKAGANWFFDKSTEFEEVIAVAGQQARWHLADHADPRPAHA